MALNPYAAPQAELELALQPADTPRLFAWNERIGRVRFLVYCLLGLLLTILFGLFARILVQFAGFGIALGSMAGQILTALTLLFFVLAIGAAIRRRLHDFDVSSWWTLLLFVPIFQFIFLIYLLVSPGTPESNRFGPPPAPNGLAVKACAVIGCLLLGGPIVLRFL